MIIDTTRIYNTDQLSENKIDELIRLYPTSKNKDLASKFNVNVSLIISIAARYGVKKDGEWLKQMRADLLVDRNKNITGRDLTPSLLKEIALQYNSKREFAYKDASAYTTANRFGIMEDITKHMVSPSFSIPQIITRQITEHIFNKECIYNTRRVIAPYELDVYFKELKIAFEYDGKGWHKNDSLDKVAMCKDKGILLIKIVERDRKYRNDIQNQLIENIGVINRWCGTKITIDDILSFDKPIDFPILFTEEELFILRNNDKSFLYKNHTLLYNRYVRYNPDNKVFTCVKWTDETVEEGLKKYSSVNQLLRENHGLYLAIHKRFRHLLPLYI